MPYAKGTCVTCGKTPAAERSRCAACLRARRKAESEQRDQRRADGLCLTCGAKAVKDRRYCKADLAYYNQRYKALPVATKKRKR